MPTISQQFPAVLQDRALGRFIGLFKNQDETTTNIVNPNLQDFAEIFLDEIQEAYDASLALANSFDVTTAVGAQLDLLGIVLDERRQGLSDADYREILRLKTFIISSDGALLKVVNAVKELTGGTIVTWSDSFPAGVTITTNGKLASAYILAQINEITGAAILPNVSTIAGLPFSLSDESSSTPTAGASHNRYDYEYVPAITTGGGLGDVDNTSTAIHSFIIEVNNVANTTVYSFDVELKQKSDQATRDAATISYTSDGSATATEIVDGLKAALLAEYPTALLGVNISDVLMVNSVLADESIPVITNYSTDLTLAYEAGEMADNLSF